MPIDHSFFFCQEIFRKCLDTLQSSISVKTSVGMLEKLETIARQLNLNFIINLLFVTHKLVHAHDKLVHAHAFKVAYIGEGRSNLCSLFCRSVFRQHNSFSNVLFFFPQTKIYFQANEPEIHQEPPTSGNTLFIQYHLFYIQIFIEVFSSPNLVNPSARKENFLPLTFQLHFKMLI